MRLTLHDESFEAVATEVSAVAVARPIGEVVAEETRWAFRMQ